MPLFTNMDISASGLTAERLRMDVVANNIANATATRTPEGGAYRRQRVVFTPRAAHDLFRLPGARPDPAGERRGVRVLGIAPDQSPLKKVYDPGHPDADGKGYVEMPNVNVVTEMVDMITASRAYEANASAIRAAKSMFQRALGIGRST